MCFLDDSVGHVKHRGDPQLLGIAVMSSRGSTSRSGLPLEDSLMQSLLLVVLRGANYLERFLVE